MNRCRAVLAWSLVAAAAPAWSQGPDWRQVATAHDRHRLRDWRSAWMQGLKAARAGDGTAALDADPALFDPDRALSDPLPPTGNYRCRAVKLGGVGVTHGFDMRPWGTCRIEQGEDGSLRLSRMSGVQRPTGIIFADTDARAVFLGTMVLSDETQPLPYGRDDARDLAGWVERVGRQSWRVVLPYPRYESVLDVVELEPAIN